MSVAVASPPEGRRASESVAERRLDRALAAAAALLVFVTHFASPIVTSFDSRWSIHTAASIAHRGDTDVDEYDRWLRESENYGIDRRGRHAYSRYPIGASLVAVPAVLLLDLAAGVLPIPDSEALIEEGRAATLEVAVASAVVAATTAVLFFVARTCGLGPAASLLIALVFAFCTPAWSTASRGLWQHGPSMLMLALALLLLLGARSRPIYAALAALPLAFGLVVRPTNGVPLLVFAAYVLWRHPRQAAGFVVLAALVLLPFVRFNSQLYGMPLSPYYYPSGQPVASAWDVPMAALGHLVSPNRGLLVFSPVLALAAVGAWVKLRDRTFDALDVAVAASVAGHVVVISTAGQWWAGHSFGPRFFTDVLPLLTYFVIFVFLATRELRPVRAAARRSSSSRCVRGARSRSSAPPPTVASGRGTAARSTSTSARSAPGTGATCRSCAVSAATAGSGR